MASLFLKVLNMGVAAGWLILAVLLFRLIFKKAPGWTRCVLWTLVAIRLLCPVSFESVLSLIPSAQTIPQQVITGSSFDVDTGFSILDTPVNDYLGDRYFEEVTVPAANGDTVVSMLSVLWILGIAALGVYAAIGYLRLKRRVRASLPLRDNVWICDEIQTPFLLGWIAPKIYLPSDTTQAKMPYILAHENAHLRRGDHWWKLLGFLLLAVYWFQPLVWVAYLLFCRDLELACDEKATHHFTKEDRIAYAKALLECSISRQTPFAQPLAFGEINVKQRVASVLRDRKPARWVAVAASAVCVLLAVCFLTNPVTEKLDYKEVVLGRMQLELVEAESLTGMDQYGDGDYLQLEISGAALADYLNGTEWSRTRFPSFGAEKEGWIRFMLDDTCSIQVLQEKSQAIVRCDGETQYYQLQDGDFQQALELLHPEDP